MQEKRKNRWYILAAVLIGSFLTLGILYRKECLAAAEVNRLQEHLAGEVFRFHVLANSDSDEDQALKLKVKDGVVTYMKEHLPESGSAEETKVWCRNHLTSLTRAAEQILKDNGSDYTVKARVTKCDFPDKTYGDITFPAGRYDALEILIGEAKGHNWWCVLYPDLCFIDSVNAVVPEDGKKKLKSVLTEDEYDMVTAMDEFKVKWFFFN